MDILDLIASDNYIPYNRTLAKQIGVENAIIFGALCGYQRHYKQQEFYREQQNIMEDTCLTEYSVRKAIKELKQLQLIDVVKKGLPAKYYYKINTTTLIEMLSTSGYENSTTGHIENLNTSNIENRITINKNNNNKKENKNNNINNTVKEIFDFWNLQDIIKHKELTDNIVKVIDKTLKEYSVEQVKEYIERYSKVIKNKEYFFKAKWTLTEFLKQKNAMPDFKDDGSKWINYKNRNKKYHKYEERTEWKKADFDNLYDNIEDINI